ncbi:preprotein translocase subunit SecY, partial [Streptomyces albiflaviniger]|nr:preprotein translocase subunit SecY [Streptomyces albiflaviniger]
MLTAFARAFKTPDLRKKLLFTLGIIVLFRLGQHVPIPGIDYKNVQTCMDLAKGQQGLFGLVNMFSGGALLQITIFALGIMPYITASIILQLLTVVIPRLEALKKEGQAGQGKITQYTRYLTIALAILQGTGLVATARSGSLFQSCPVGGQIVRDDSIFTTAVMVITMTAGTALIMWLGELVTDRGIGNGMSILMFVSIAAGFPSAMWSIKQQGKIMDGWLEFGLVILCGLAMVGLVVFVEQAQRRIPVQYAKRMIG